MNHTDPPAAGPSWRQVFIQFDDFAAAEHAAVTHLGPEMIHAESAGLVTAWFFIRKSPCWRLRFLTPHVDAEQDTAAFIHQRLDRMQKAGHIARWVENIYEPEVHAFGGTAAMDIAHHLFHHDSRHIVDYLGGDRLAVSTGRRDQRRELSILLCGLLMRAAEQDWYEQGDIWARVADSRPLPADVPLDRVHSVAPDLRRLMTVDASLASTLQQDGGPLTAISGWTAAFEEAGKELGEAARDGTLHRGLRGVLAHHVIFHWNRIGLPYNTQSVLANAATTIVFEQ